MSTTLDDRRLSARRATRQILSGHGRTMATVSGCALLAALLEAVFLALVTQSILTIAAGDQSFSLMGNYEFSVTRAAVFGIIFLAIRFGLLLVTVRSQNRLFESLLIDLRSELGDAYLHSSWPVQSRFQRGLLQQLLVQFPASIVSLVYQVVAALTGGLALAALLVVAFVIEPVTALVVFGMVILLASCLLPVRRAVRRRAAHALDDQMRFATSVSETADLSLEVNAMYVADQATERLDRLVSNEAQAQRRMGFFRDLVNPIYTTLAFGAIVVAVVVLREFGRNDLQATGTVLLIMLRSLSYGQQLQHGASALAQIAPALERLETHRAELVHERRDRGHTTLETFSKIEFRNVIFSYDDARRVLDEVSLTISRGEIVGVVGSSGAGKTTLVNLLLGLLEPTSGTIVVDSTSIESIDPASWSKLVAYVPQESRLLDGSIADNVRFLRAQISAADVERAVEQAGLRLDSQRFPEGLDTDVGAAGRELSGGQRQRLAIARALATTPTLLVLDEPTSALDAESDEAVVETIRRLRGSVAVIVVSHRESTLTACDRVVVVDQGRVTDRP
jgi:ABC-type multidrug transport system fused ATPase/permease subunit